MLFSGLACFSPQVPLAIRKLWVKNGGTLTHTEDDFRKANFFFCQDMEDPWLNELLSRSLIVRHAAWVTLCVIEDFIMPIADYTLDGGFDETKICNLELPEVAAAVAQNPAPLLEDPKDDPIHAIVNERKRRLGDDEEIQDRQRPKKRVKRDLHKRPLAFSTVPQAQKMVPGPNKKLENPDAQEIEKTTFNGVEFPPKTFLRPTRVPRATKTAFEKCIVRSEYATKPPPSRKQGERPVTPLNAHTLFWNNILAKSFPRNGTTSLNVSVGDLVRAPRTKAVIFDVNKTYLGKPFINLDNDKNISA